MMRQLRRLANSDDPRSFANRLRSRRLEQLGRLLADLNGAARILDVGGTPRFWQLHPAILENVADVTVLNIVPQTSDLAKVKPLLGTALDLGQFGTRSFDVVFSNSVIEHVGDFAAQRTMAAEVRRVGRRYLVQTPNRHFPLEPHFLVPGFQFMPERVQVGLLLKHDLGWHRRAPNREDALRQIRGVRLMTVGELATCFPDGTIHRERILGFTKSMTAIRAG